MAHTGYNKLHDRIDIHKSVVEKTPEGLIRLADPVDGRTAVMVLVPFDGQVEYLVIFFLEEIAAQIEGEAALHDAGGSVEAPLEKFYTDIAGDIEKWCNGKCRWYCAGVCPGTTRIAGDLGK